MSLVGPGGSGKTRLICNVSITSNLSSQAAKYLLLLQGISAIIQRMAEKLNIEFVPCLDFEMIKKLENCLLVSDDSCEDIYQKKEIVKIAVAGRQKRLIAFSSNRIWFIRASGPVPLTSIQHFLPFESERDVQQIDHFG